MFWLNLRKEHFNIYIMSHEWVNSWISRFLKTLYYYKCAYNIMEDPDPKTPLQHDNKYVKCKNEHNNFQFKERTGEGPESLDKCPWLMNLPTSCFSPPTQYNWNHQVTRLWLIALSKYRMHLDWRVFLARFNKCYEFGAENMYVGFAWNKV